MIHIITVQKLHWTNKSIDLRHVPLLQKLAPDLLAWIWAVGVALALFWLFHDYGFDDPFITYRYAANLAAGEGFVYNAGERILSTTAPLYAALLAVFRLAGADIAATSNAISCLSLSAGGLAFWYLSKRGSLPMAGAAGLLLYPTFAPLIVMLGSEMPLVVALMLIATTSATYRRLHLTAVLLALATLVRADGALTAVVLGGYALLMYRSIPWRMLFLFVALLAPWFIVTWLYFGTPLPVTLAAKQQQATLAVSQSFGAGIWPRLRNYWDMPLAPLHIALASAGLVYGLFRRLAWMLVPLWGLIFTIAYTALGVTSYFWYYAPLAAGSVALVALGMESIYRLARRHMRAPWAVAPPVTLIIALLAMQGGQLYAMRDANDQRFEIYREVGKWLYSNTPPDASVATLEVGIIGFYAQRHMIDFAGLIQPDVALQLNAKTTYEDAALWAVDRYQPNFLVLHEGTFRRMEASMSQNNQCQIIERFEHSSYSRQLAVYACMW